MADQPKHVTYADAGVDVDEGARAVDCIKDAVKATNRPEVIGGLGGFGSCFSMKGFKDMEDPVLVSGTDGVGTKLAIAQLLDRHDTVGEDLVAMCVDDVVPIGAEPLFFLDYVAIGKLRAEHVAQIVKGIAEGCKKSGCALVGGEMAEHPGVMNPDDYDLAGFVVGVVDRPKMIGPEKVKVGDVILGLPSSGIHSNGYSLVRKTLDINNTYAQHSDELGCTLGEALLVPTRIYVRAIEALSAAGVDVHAISHITGGGFYENVPRMMQPGLTAHIDVSTFPMPRIFDIIQKTGSIPVRDMYNTFNMGIGMIAAVPAADADQAIAALKAAGETAYLIGSVVNGEDGVEVQL